MMKRTAVALRHFRIPGSTRRLPNGKWPRRSSIAAIGAYSLNNQFFVSIAPNLYFGGETWNVAGSVNSVWFPGVFYNVGHDSAESSAENYTQRLFSGSIAVTRRIIASLRIGAKA